MKYKNILTDLENGLFTVTLNRPSKLNALNIQTIQELDHVFQVILDKDEIKVVILTGMGDKAFAAGADIAEIAELNDVNGRKFSERGQEVFQKIENCSKPVIAAVNGFALGGGFELALACHFRLGSENSKFGLPELKLGVIPGYGGTQRLSQVIGKGKAMEMVLTGEMIDAKEALALKIVNYVVPIEKLIATVKVIATKILGNAPLAIAQAIDCINTSLTPESGYDLEANSFGNSCKTADFKEGTSAFLEKRKPQFKGA